MRLRRKKLSERKPRSSYKFLEIVYDVDAFKEIKDRLGIKYSVGAFYPEDKSKLSDLKKLEIFPLAGTSIPDHLFSDDGFQLEVKKALRNRAYSRIEFTDGTAVQSTLADPVLSVDGRLEWSVQSVTPVSSLGGYKETRVVSRPLSSVRNMPSARD